MSVGIGPASSSLARVGPGPGPTPTRRISCTDAPAANLRGSRPNTIGAAKRTIVSLGGKARSATPSSMRALMTPSRRAAGRPSPRSAAFTVLRSKSVASITGTLASSPDLSSRSRMNRAITSPTSGCEEPPTRRSSRPSGVVTIRPRTSGTAMMVNLTRPTRTSFSWTSTWHSRAKAVTRSAVRWLRGAPISRRSSSTPRITRPPSVMLMAAKAATSSLGVPRLNSSCSCSTSPKMVQKRLAGIWSGSSERAGTVGIRPRLANLDRRMGKMAI